MVHHGAAGKETDRQTEREREREREREPQNFCYLKRSVYALWVYNSWERGRRILKFSLN